MSPNKNEDHPFAEFFADSDASTQKPSSETSKKTTRRESREKKPKSERRGLKATLAVLGLVVALGGVGAFLFSTFQPQIESIFAAPESGDYSGDGTGEVMFVINEGDSGEMIGDNLEEAGVIKTSKAFYDILVKSPEQPEFHPGTFALAKKMSAQSALDALLDETSKIDYTVTFPEGTNTANMLDELVEVTGIPLADFQAVTANYTALGVQAEAPSIEGFLFPAQYTFQPDVTATEILQEMVNRTFSTLDAAGVAPENRFYVITFAALIQNESGSVEDMFKVSRVFVNRLEQGMNLQSDATVSYGAGHSKIETTQAEREDASNLYNTYANPGLPIGPITNPGADAIQAAIAPAEGPWLFFVTVNLDTGETVFSVTAEEHEAAVDRLQQWWDDHPEIE